MVDTKRGQTTEEGGGGVQPRADFRLADPGATPAPVGPRRIGSAIRPSAAMVAVVILVSAVGLVVWRRSGAESSPSQRRTVGEVFSDNASPPSLVNDLGRLSDSSSLVRAAAGAGVVAPAVSGQSLPVGVQCEAAGRAAASSLNHLRWAGSAQYKGAAVVVLAFSPASSERPLDLFALSTDTCQLRLKGHLS